MNRVNFLLLAIAAVPLFAQADPMPAEINYCTVSAAGLDNAAQKNIALMCGAGLATKALIAKYQPDPAAQSGGVGMSGALGNLFGGSAKPAVVVNPASVPGHVSNNNLTPVAVSPVASVSQPAATNQSGETSIYK
jgi:hypothetical protein